MGVPWGTLKLMFLQPDFMLRQKSFSREAVLMIWKPSSPPKVEGFQYRGLQMGLARSPFTLHGPPILTMERGVTEGPERSVTRPEEGRWC